MAHTITIEFDQEHEDTLTEMVAAYNTQNGTSITADAFLAIHAQAPVAEQVKKNFEARTNQITEGAALLDYQERQELIALNQNFIASKLAAQ